MGKHCLPDHLKDETHWDWPSFTFKIGKTEYRIGLHWVPRSWTASCGGHRAPIMLLGLQKERRCCEKYIKMYDPLTAEGPAPIGEPWSFQFCWPFYIAFSLWRSKKDGKYTHFRFGWRWDDVDGYYNFSMPSRRRYTGDRIEDTSTK